jgi:hypothetical protein
MKPTMTTSDRSLVHRLIAAVLVKLVLLAALWWLFFSGSHGPVDAGDVARHFGAPAPAQGDPR